MTEYERMLLHRALWIWCAETGKSKYNWLGWYKFKTDWNRCFLCVDKIYSNNNMITICETGKSKLCTSSRPALNCLGGIYHNINILRRKLNKHNSWINRRAYQLACYRIAFVEWKVKPEGGYGVYVEVLRKLQSVYGADVVRFVPKSERDFNQFMTAYWRN